MAETIRRWGQAPTRDGPAWLAETSGAKVCIRSSVKNQTPVGKTREEAGNSAPRTSRDPIGVRFP